MIPAIVITSSNILLVGAVLILAAIFTARGIGRFGMPTLILFLFVGMFFGVDGVGIEFDESGTVQFVGMLALCIILFSGGMDTSYKAIRPVASVGIVLSTVGVLLTALIAGVGIFYISRWFGIELTLIQSLLLASLFSSTDSASVFAILRGKKQGLKQNLKPLLELESGSNDPMAYLLMVLLMSVIAGGESISAGRAIYVLLRELLLGGISGYLFGQLTVWIVNKIKLPNNSLYSTLLLALLFFAFAITEIIEGNEYLAVYVMGLVVGNSKLVFKRTMTTFFDGFTWLFQIVMFVMLGLLVNPRNLLSVALFGIAVSVLVIIFVRPIAVFLSLSPFRKITRKAKIFISWVGLRGATPIIFATYPLVAGTPHGDIMFNTVFVITIISLLVQGTTVGLFAKRLGLSTEEKGSDNMGFDIPDNVSAALMELVVNDELLRNGNQLKDIPIEDNQLVMMIERGKNHIVPKGSTPLQDGDKLLIISTNCADLPPEYKSGYRKHNRRKTKTTITNS